jgi:hypothetical protein
MRESGDEVRGGRGRSCLPIQEVTGQKGRFECRQWIVQEEATFEVDMEADLSIFVMGEGAGSNKFRYSIGYD